jgi:FecR protein
MSTQNFENESPLDRVIGEIRDEQIDPAAMEAAAGRVWSRIAGAASGPRLVEKIRSCEDFQALFADYRAGRLPEARRLLVEDHTHECVGCRKVLEGRAKVAQFPAVQPRRRNVSSRWAVAAAVVAGVGLSTFGIIYYMNGPSGSRATVAIINGTLYRLSDTGSVAVKAGDELPAGAEIRTAKDSSAMIRLRDGSMVEMRERTGFSVAESGRDLTVNLGLGNIIVQAAKRRTGHLFVTARDCKVAVTGTVFSVNSGVKGSRVAVIEGEVHVTRDKVEKVLHPGDQYTSSASLSPVALQEEIAWSRNFEHLNSLLKLQKDLEQVHLPDLRYSSRLMELVSASTAIYISVPNLGKTLAEAQQVIRSHMTESPELARWWGGMEAHGFKPDDIIGKIGQFSDYVGSEIVLAAPIDESGHLGLPVILAELKRPGFRQFIRSELDKAGKANAGLHIIDDAAQATSERGVWMLVRPDLLAITPDPAALRFGAGAFAKTPFGTQVAAAYRNGAGILFSADLEHVARNAAGHVPTGLSSIRTVMLEQKENAGRPEMRATVGFAGDRQGFFAWLAAPAPMRALDFITPDAAFVAAFAMKAPGRVLEELQSTGLLASHDMDEAQSKYGINVKADLAAPLGGEFAVALDGPMLPPSWKLVVEVYDSARLENTIERLVEMHNSDCAGTTGCRFQLSHEAVNGRTYHALKMPDVPFGDAQYTFIDGYLLAAPSRQLLDRAVQYRSMGNTLPRSAQFMALVPRDHYSNFSAMVYQNAGPQLAPLAGLLAGTKILSPEQQKAAGEIAAQLKPSLFTAYGEADRITVAAGGSLLGLSMNNLIQGNLMGVMPNFGIPGIFQTPGTHRRQPAYR